MDRTRLPAVIALSLLLTASACKQGGDPNPQVKSPLEVAIERTIKNSQPVPNTGVGVAVVQNGRVLLLKGYGFRDHAKRAMFDVNTLFPVGSVTKGMTAVLLSKLSEEGVLNLEAPIRTYLPAFELKDPVATAQTQSIDLLAHRTGFPQNDFIYSSTFTREEIFSRLKFFDRDTRPGKGFREGLVYSNAMYSVAGLLAEAVGGRSWEELMRQKIFSPLGMAQTKFDKSGLDSTPNSAKPYLSGVETAIADTRRVNSAGSVDSTLNDLVHYLKFHLSGGLAESGTRLLSEQSMKRLYAPHVQLSADYSYGLGWNVRQYAGYRHILHEGHFTGFSSLVSFIPERSLGVVVLVGDHLSILTDQLERAIYSELAGISLLARTTSPGPRYVLNPPKIPSAPIPAGRFRHPAYGDLVIHADGTEAFARYFDRWLPMEQIDNTHYKMTISTLAEENGAATTVGAEFIASGTDITAMEVNLIDGILPVRFEWVPL